MIDVPAATGGLVLRILMNAELDKALGMLAPPQTDAERAATKRRGAGDGAAPPEGHWRWRLQMAERIAAEIDPEAFGVRGMWLFGSTKNGTAGPASDIDLLVHVDDDPRKRAALVTWLDGWSLCLSEMNFLRTGLQDVGPPRRAPPLGRGVRARVELRCEGEGRHRPGPAAGSPKGKPGLVSLFSCRTGPKSLSSSDDVGLWFPLPSTRRERVGPGAWSGLARSQA